MGIQNKPLKRKRKYNWAKVGFEPRMVHLHVTDFVLLAQRIKRTDDTAKVALIVACGALVLAILGMFL